MTRLKSDGGPGQVLMIAIVAALLIVLTIALKMLPYQQVSRWLPRSGATPVPAWRKRQIAKIVARTSKVIPGATCLPQAMVGYILLAARGCEGRIRVGVLKEEGAPFRAHAMLVSGSDVLTGRDGDFDKFTLLTELRPGR